jgi:hypothetical protein
MTVDQLTWVCPFVFNKKPYSSLPRDSPNLALVIPEDKNPFKMKEIWEYCVDLG